MTDSGFSGPLGRRPKGLSVSADEAEILHVLKRGRVSVETGEKPLDEALGETQGLVRDLIRAMFEKANEKRLADAGRQAAHAAAYASWPPERRADYDRVSASLTARIAADGGRVVAEGPRPKFTPVESSGEVALSAEQAIQIARGWAGGEETIDPSRVSLKVDRWRFVLNVNGRDIAPDEEALCKILEKKDVYEVLGWTRLEGTVASVFMLDFSSKDNEVSCVVKGNILLNCGRFKLYQKGDSYIFDCRPGTGGVSCVQFKDGKFAYGRL